MARGGNLRSPGFGFFLRVFQVRGEVATIEKGPDCLMLLGPTQRSQELAELQWKHKACPWRAAELGDAFKFNPDPGEAVNSA